MYQPQLIEIDPQRIKFSTLNPRKHGGEEFTRLKQSIQEIGIVQMPLVRVLPAGFYEVIDGEGRVRAAQELYLPKIMVTSLGVVNDQEALTMLVSSNAVREFGFLAECRGLANLNRQGQSGNKLAKSLGMTERNVAQYLAIGYFPDDLHKMIEEYNLRNMLRREGEEDKNGMKLGYRALIALLPLRQLIPGKDPQNSSTLEGVYDYTEVHRAIEKIVQGNPIAEETLRAYVEQRRRELFEQRFNQELQQRLQTELAQTKQALEEANEQKIHDVEEVTKRRFEAQVAVLQEQLKDMEERHTKIVREVAKKPDEKKLIEQREKELRQQMQKTEVERQRLQSLQQQMQAEMQEELKKTQQKTLEELRRKIDADLSEQRKTMKQEQQKAEADLKAYYAQKDQERQLKAEESVRQMRAHGVELLAQTQQWILHITSPNMMHGLEWLDQAETVSLLAQIRTVRDILEEAEEKLRYGNAVPQAGTVINEASDERSLVRGN